MFRKISNALTVLVEAILVGENDGDWARLVMY